MSDQDAIIQLLKKERSFYLVSHMLPDGDSIGSMLAFGEALISMGKEVKYYSPGGVPPKYRFLKGSERITDCIDFGGQPVIVVLDCSDLERAGSFQQYLSRGNCLINIDHHVTNQRFGSVNLVVPDAAATGEIIYSLLLKMGIKITEHMAEALYVAIATDTGSFKFENTTPATLRVAADLLEYGLNPGLISQKVFDERPLSFYLLLKEALSTLEIEWNYRIATMVISKDMMERSGSSLEEIDGMINYTRNIQGIQIGILFYVENEKEVKVGFRSRSVDVSLLAGRLNGGGHARAAGCRMTGSFEQVKDKVLNEAVSLIKEAGV